MSESQDSPKPHENPFKGTTPQEAITVMQDIFRLIPQNNKPIYEEGGLERINKRKGSELYKAASVQLGELLEISPLVPCAQAKVVELFQSAFRLGRGKVDELVEDPYIQKWSEDFGWNDSTGGIFGENGKIYDAKLYRDELSAFVQIRSQAREMAGEVEESGVSSESVLGNFFSGKIEEILNDPNNKRAALLRKWRKEYAEKWKEEP